MNEMTATNGPTEQVIERVFDAPRELLWRAWTDPEWFMRWWGPAPFTSPWVQMDLQPGGRFVWVMRDPDGQEYYTVGEFREIDPPSRLVYTDSFGDAEGNVVSPTTYGMGDDFPVTTVVTVTFEDLGGQTRLRIASDQAVPGNMWEMASAGWYSSLDKLAAVVTKQVRLAIDREKLQIVVARDFDAPPALVWRALTEPALLTQWWGQPGSPMSVDKHELQPGGQWRYVERDAAGNEYGFRGVFREIEPPRRIVQTFEYEPMAGHVIVETMTLTTDGDRTTLTTVQQFDTLEDLEGMYASGMEGGMETSYNQLAALLAQLA
jgi:uncharacterized protein YndB with AHSA1/START domain